MGVAFLNSWRVMLFAGMVVGIVSGCLTPAKERQLNDDIFNLQTRLLQLENKQSSSDKTIQSRDESANQRLASTSTTLEKLNVDIQRMRGEIDALRVGVMTGQMPGTDPEQEGSVAKTLTELGKRLDALEESQKAILEAIEKAQGDKEESSKDKKSASKEKDGDKIRSYGDLKKAFESKRYQAVADEAGDILKSTKKKSQKEEIAYFHAESLFKLGKLRDAALKFNDFVDMKPSAKRLTQAKLRMGDCFRQLGDKDTAKLYYEELVSKHPKSSEAKKAKELLRKL